MHGKTPLLFRRVPVNNIRIIVIANKLLILKPEQNMNVIAFASDNELYFCTSARALKPVLQGCSCGCGNTKERCYTNNLRCSSVMTTN